MSLDGGFRSIDRLVMLCCSTMMRQQCVALAASGVTGSLLDTYGGSQPHECATCKKDHCACKISSRSRRNGGDHVETA